MTDFLPLLSSEPPAVVDQTLSQLRLELPEMQICTIDELSTEQRASITVAITANPAPQILDELPNLVWLQSLWAGVEALISPARERQLQLVRLVDPQLAHAMAEAALAWTLYLHRSMPDYARQQRNQQWQTLPWRHASDVQVTVLGLGKLGSACANRLNANGFKVSGWSQSQHTLPGVTCYSGQTGLARVLSVTDILLVLLPLTEHTHSLLNANTLKQLPTNAALINFARGAIVETDDLLELLDNAHLSHAVLDVFETEPLPSNHRLWVHPSVTVLPHIAAPTDPTSAAKIAANNIRTYRSTGVIPESVDLERGF